MKVFGIVFNHNVLAVMLGLAMILFCLATAYLFQKNLFGRYRRQVPHTGERARGKQE